MIRDSLLRLSDVSVPQCIPQNVYVLVAYLCVDNFSVSFLLFFFFNL